VRPHTGRVHGRVTGRVHGRVHGRVTCRVPVTRRPCTRPVNTSSTAKTARTRPYNGRAVYTTRTWPCMGRAHGRVHDTYTAAYMCLRVYVYMGRVHGRVRTIYTVENGRLHGRPCNVSCIRPCTAVSACVHGSVRAVCTAVFGRGHWPSTLPFSAVYIAHTRPCNGPFTLPLDGRVQGSSGPCIRQVGLPGRVHLPRQHATAVCGPLRHTVRVRDRVYGSCRRTCTRLCMGRVHDRVHGRNVPSRPVYTAV